jgi:hypothetical protein
MPEETNKNTMNGEQPTGATPDPADAGPSTDELFEEVQRLGSRFAQVLQTAWNSDERKQIETEVRKGLSAMASGVEDGLNKVSEDERTRNVVDQADDVMTSMGETIRSSEVTKELTSSLATGLRKVSDTLSKWVNEQTTQPPADAGEDEEQDIPVEKG